MQCLHGVRSLLCGSPGALWMRPGCLRWLRPTLGAPADDLAADTGRRRVGRGGHLSAEAELGSRVGRVAASQLSPGRVAAQLGPARWPPWNASRLMSGRSCMTAQQPAALCSGRPAPAACLSGPHALTRSSVCGRVVYVYRAKKVTNGSKYRAIWGKVTRRMATTVSSGATPEELPASDRGPVSDAVPSRI